jgi:hypothetical protein
MDRHVADHEKNLVHATVVADSGTNANEERTNVVDGTLIFMVNARLIFIVKSELTGPLGRIDREGHAD